MEKIREPAVSGQFYLSDKEELKSMIEGFMQNARKIAPKPIGIISPHAGYEFSGQTAAHAYKAISNQKFGTFIIIGTNHSGDETSISMKDFMTPLGTAKNDLEFCRELEKLGTKVDEQEHAFEHSIEVQIPFLQTMFKNFKIVPIAASFKDYKECKEFAERVFKTIKKLKRKVCIIASGDFTHYGSSYNYLPFEPSRSKIYAVDKKAMDFISELKAKEFFDYARNTTICGISAFSASIEICKMLGAKKAELLNYSNSGDASKEFESCVSYASFVIE